MSAEERKRKLVRALKMGDEEDDGLMLNFMADDGSAGGDEQAPTAKEKKKRMPFYEAKKLRIAAKRAGRGSGRPTMGSKGENNQPRAQQGGRARVSTTGAVNNKAMQELPDNIDKVMKGKVVASIGKVDDGIGKVHPSTSTGEVGVKGLREATGQAQNVRGVAGDKARNGCGQEAPGPGIEVVAAPEGGIVEAEGEEDIMAAVNFMMTHEKNIEKKLKTEGLLTAAGSDEDSGADDDDSPGETKTVSFMSKHEQENFKLASGPKRKHSAESTKEAQPKRTKPKSSGIGTVRSQQGFREGELLHTRLDMTDEERQELFGDIDASNFRGLGLAESLCDHLEDINFSEPTRVQSASIPWLLKGRDALVNAPTGSGKTLAYLAPVVHFLQSSEDRLTRDLGTHAIVIAPTRELVVQIHDVLMMILRRYHWLVGGMLMGGEQRSREKARLRKGVMVLVATPGRLLDHLQNTESFRTTELKWLIMDEADRLLDLGFEKKMEEIVGILDKRLEEARTGPRQTALFSATMHSNLGKLATLSLRNPVAVGFRAKVINGELQVQGAEGKDGTAAEGAGADGGEGDGEDTTTYTIPSTLKQSYVEVPCKLRAAALLAFISSQCRPGKKTKMVVFLSSCDTVDFAHHLVNEVFPSTQGAKLTNVPVLKLHGNMRQDQRLTSFLTFTKQSAAVLLCTDVAARGLDFPEVTSILQFDPPGAVSEYVHRVGRAARMGRQGEATLFLMPSEMAYTSKLNEVGAVLEKGDIGKYLDYLPLHPETPKVGKRPGQPAWDLQQRLVKCVATNSRSKEMAQCAFRTFVRAYSTHPRELKPVFHPKRLHLGHLAQSFNLRDTPTMMGQSASKAEKVRRQKDAQVAAKNNEKKRSGSRTLHTGASKLKLIPTVKKRRI